MATELALTSFFLFFFLFSFFSRGRFENELRKIENNIGYTTLKGSTVPNANYVWHHYVGTMCHYVSTNVIHHQLTNITKSSIVLLQTARHRLYQHGTYLKKAHFGAFVMLYAIVLMPCQKWILENFAFFARYRQLLSTKKSGNFAEFNSFVRVSHKSRFIEFCWKIKL